MRTTILGAILVSLCLNIHASAEPIKYQITPLTLADGYELTGGFLETDGTLGLLDSSNITDFSATISGPVPYTFSSSIDGTTVSVVGELRADSSSLWIEEDTGSGGSLEISALDNSAADCGDCHQDIAWLNSLESNTSSLTYDHHDHSDDMPDSGFKSFTLASPQAALTIGHAVPEPGSSIGLAVGVLVLCISIRRSRR